MKISIFGLLFAMVFWFVLFSLPNERSAAEPAKVGFSSSNGVSAIALTTPQNLTFVGNTDDGKPLIVFHSDGTVEANKSLKPDDAARQLLEAFQRIAPGFLHPTDNFFVGILVLQTNYGARRTFLVGEYATEDACGRAVSEIAKKAPATDFDMTLGYQFTCATKHDNPPWMKP